MTEGPYVMRYVQRAGSTYNAQPDELRGDFLMSFDPEFANGHGAAVWTPDLAQAMRFESATAGHQLWRTQSQTMPRRADGRPNRPLTAYTIEMVPLALAEVSP